MHGVFFCFLVVLQHHHVCSDEEMTPAVVCKDEELICADGSSCVSGSDLCDGVENCPDKSDENDIFCNALDGIDLIDNSNNKETCGKGFMKCENEFGFKCMSLLKACESPFCSDDIFNSSKVVLCSMIDSSGRIRLEEANECCDSKLKEMNTYFMQVLIQSYERNTNDSCPFLYSMVGDHCLSSFLPIKLSWKEANDFCQSIGGTLAKLQDINLFYNVMQHLRTFDIEADVWIGGQYDSNHSSWVWTDGSNVVQGTPFWALGCHNPHCLMSKEDCKIPVHPLTSREGKCLSMSDEFSLLFMENDCDRSKTPLCMSDLATCLYEGKTIGYGKEIEGKDGSRRKCLDGDMILISQLPCLVNDRYLDHGVKVNLPDGIERQCDNGTVKPLNYVGVKTICKSPFEMVENVGCVWIFKKVELAQPEALAKCQEYEAVLFEMKNYTNQKEYIRNFLSRKGVTKSEDNDRLWVGAMRYSSGGKFYWTTSGTLFEDKGDHRNEAWLSTEPSSTDDGCTYIGFEDMTFRDMTCSTNLYTEYAFCQIPFV